LYCPAVPCISFVLPDALLLYVASFARLCYLKDEFIHFLSLLGCCIDNGLAVAGTCFFFLDGSETKPEEIAC
jgi:hypothetical protein